MQSAKNKLGVKSAEAVGQAYGFPFPEETGEKAWAFLEHVGDLPEDVKPSVSDDA